MMYYTVMRPLMNDANPDAFSVTVCVPCRNEEGNIANLAERIPEMGKGTEIIFVDDQSTDGTADLIEKAISQHPEKRIRMVKGPGRNKGAACRAGFAEARNDILMILDADMAVMPEDLVSFYDALVSGKGEFINGSRLVYPMEDRAMKFANVIGNKAFAVLFSFVLSQRLKDTLCGTKVIWRRDYGKILEARKHFGEIDRWGDYDWIFGAARHNLKIAELPVHYRERVSGGTKMTKRLQNAWTMLKMCNVAFRRLKLL
jgi:glycosyltransferase involved in cell wall biosynthesis